MNLDDPNTTQELSGLSQILVGSMSLYPNLSDRWTHSFHPMNDGSESEPQFSRMDDIMLSPHLLRDVEVARVISYLDQEGRVMRPPRNYRERQRQPSDHRPVFIRINTRQLF